MQYMLDINICIFLIKRKPPAVIQRFNTIRVADVGISSITSSELTCGVAKSSNPDRNRLALAQFVAPLEILPYGDDAAEHYGLLRSCLEKNGTPIGTLDMLIAAHALALDCVLVTNNEKEFNRVQGLRIENWAK